MPNKRWPYQTKMNTSLNLNVICEHFHVDSIKYKKKMKNLQRFTLLHIPSARLYTPVHCTVTNRCFGKKKYKFWFWFGSVLISLFNSMCMLLFIILLILHNFSFMKFEDKIRWDNVIHMRACLKKAKHLYLYRKPYISTWIYLMICI